MSMRPYMLEMVSTSDPNDVRYRSYTTSVRKRDKFLAVPPIKFTDSGHKIVPQVRHNEVNGKRRPPLIRALERYVKANME